MDPDFEMGMLIRGNHPMQVRQREEHEAQVRSDSQEATMLRKLMAIYNPERKDEFNAMDIGNLRGEYMGHAGKVFEARDNDLRLQVQRKQAAELQQLQRGEQQARSAQDLAALIEDAGRVQTDPFTIPARTISGMDFAPTAVPAMEGRGPVTAERLRQWLPQHPDAVNAEHFAPTLNALRDLVGGQPGFGPEAQGVARPIPGVPGRFFVPTSQGGGQVLETSESQHPEYSADSFKFDASGNPTHWKVGDAWVKWNPKMTLAPGTKAGTVRVIQPQAPNPFAALFGGGGGDGETPNPKIQTPNASNEVTRYVGGKAAIFDAKTKKFLRYAD